MFGTGLISESNCIKRNSNILSNVISIWNDMKILHLYVRTFCASEDLLWFGWTSKLFVNHLQSSSNIERSGTFNCANLHLLFIIRDDKALLHKEFYLCVNLMKHFDFDIGTFFNDIGTFFNAEPYSHQPYQIPQIRFYKLS